MNNRTWALPADKDLVTCPLTLEHLFHPVIASDGHIYELRMLRDFVKSNGKVSPITREPLTHITYLVNLKSALDELFKDETDRYDKNNYVNEEGSHEDISKEGCLKFLSAQININALEECTRLLDRERARVQPSYTTYHYSHNERFKARQQAFVISLLYGLVTYVGYSLYEYATLVGQPENESDPFPSCNAYIAGVLTSITEYGFREFSNYQYSSLAFLREGICSCISFFKTSDASSNLASVLNVTDETPALVQLQTRLG